MFAFIVVAVVFLLWGKICYWHGQDDGFEEGRRSVYE